MGLLGPTLMPRSRLRLMSTSSLLLPLLWLLQLLPMLLLLMQPLTLLPLHPLSPPPTPLPLLPLLPTPMPQLPTPDTTSVMPLLPTPTTLDSLSLLPSPLPRLNKPLVRLAQCDEKSRHLRDKPRNKYKDFIDYLVTHRTEKVSLLSFLSSAVNECNMQPQLLLKERRCERGPDPPVAQAATGYRRFTQRQ